LVFAGDGRSDSAQGNACHGKKIGIVSTHGAKVVMTTALGDIKNFAAAYQGLCDAYLVKPIGKAKLIGLLGEWKILK
jgi:hypothetical protein